MNIARISKAFFIVFCLSLSACAILDDMSAKKPATSGLIATPASYYSTAKARYLANKYKDNLDRIVERISRNPKTDVLQFANNISSVGGIGFFTHSATKTPDERYLEIVLATPETFELKGEYSEKVHQLFSRYGIELLGMLTSDSEVYQDRDLSGYGLNLAWRNKLAAPTGTRVSLERAVIYFSKERARNYLRNELSENDLLRDAVIFAVEEDGPLNLVSFKPPEPHPDFRPAIHEDNLVATPVKPKVPVVPTVASAPTGTVGENVGARSAIAKKESSADKASATAASAKSILPEIKPVVKPESDRSSKPLPAKASVVTSSSNVSAQSGEAATPKTAATMQQPRSAESKNTAAAANLELPSNIALDKAPVSGANSNEVASPLQPLENVANSDQPITLAAPAAAINLETAGERTAKTTAQQTLSMASSRPAVDSKKNEPVAPPEILNKSAAVLEQKSLEPKTQETPAVVVALPTPQVSPSEPVIVATKSVSQRSVETGAIHPVTKSSASQVVPTSSPPKSIEQKVSESASSNSTVEQASERVLSPSAAKVETPQVIEVKPTLAIAAAGPVAVVKNPETGRSTDVPKEAAPTIIAKDETAKVVDVKSLPATALPAPAAKKSTAEPAVAIAKPKELPSAAKVEPPVSVEEKSTPIIVPSPLEKVTAEKPAAEQLASLRKAPMEIAPVKPTVARSAPKALEGFIIQLAFRDRGKAQRWAESMEKRGFAVSLTEAGTEGSLRVRLGNFAIRDEAERQLKNFKQDGLNGIVINLPQAFQPEARTSIP